MGCQCRSAERWFLGRLRRDGRVLQKCLEVFRKKDMFVFGCFVSKKKKCSILWRFFNFAMSMLSCSDILVNKSVRCGVNKGQSRKK